MSSPIEGSVVEEVYHIVDNTLPPDDNIYRVVVYPNTKSVLVSCFGMEGVDVAVEGAYDSVDELPKWIQRKLAVLTMLKVDDSLLDTGRRIDEDTFWVYRS
jgi:hypothetical protein